MLRPSSSIRPSGHAPGGPVAANLGLLADAVRTVEAEAVHGGSLAATPDEDNLRSLFAFLLPRESH